MPSHDVIDERFDELVAELRAAPPGASPELRRRVQVIARQDLEREQPVRPPFSRRPAGRRALRGALALAAFALVVVAIVGGLLSLLHGSPTPRPVAGAIPTPHASAGGRRPQPYPRTPRRTLSQDLPRAVQEKGGHGAFAAGTGVGVNPQRLQQYAAWLRIRVRGLGGLSTATKRAMRLTRSYGGYVASVSYNVPGRRSGAAELVLRVPVARVQDAIAAFSGFGTILAQRVGLRDVQRSVDVRARQIAALRREIARLEALPSPQPRLAVLRARLTGLEQVQRRTVRNAQLARVSLELVAAPKAAAAHRRGALGRTLHGAAGVLAQEAVVLLWALVVFGPLVLLGVAALGLKRVRDRREEQRLLESA